MYDWHGVFFLLFINFDADMDTLLRTTLFSPFLIIYLFIYLSFYQYLLSV